MSTPASFDWITSQFPDLSNVVAISEGGQKWVFAGDHKTEGRVVLKVIKPTQDVETVQREILAVQQVNSARVPAILECGQLNTPVGICFWFREQFINGSTVDQLLQRGRLSTNQVLLLGLHVSEALVSAEGAKIVHRDVKPGNVICDMNDAFWLLDFGVARHLTLNAMTPTAAPFGKFTVGYAPLEQMRNVRAEIDSRSDLFALGVTLYECATGQNPYRHNAANPLEVLKRIEGAPLPRLKLTITAGEELADFVGALTQKRRDHRPATAQQALEWVQEICRKEGLL